MHNLIAGMLMAFFTNRVSSLKGSHNHNEDVESFISRTDTTRSLLSSSDLDRLNSMSCLPGINAVAAGAIAWIGSDGLYTNNFVNNMSEDLILVVWGLQGSWVNVVPPLITLSMAPHTNETISFTPGGGPGGWSAIYPDTQMVNGQVSNTWGEFNFGLNGVVDVSRLPNMQGHSMSIVGPQCTADMDTCVFICSSGDVCTDNYVLQNCASGNQAGAQTGVFQGHQSGGCGWLDANEAALYTQFY